MSRPLDLTGQRFGRLVAIERATNSKSGKAKWLCKCDCGNETMVFSTSLVRGLSRSCGCIHQERVRTIGSKTIPQNMAKQVEINMQYHTNFQVIGTHTPPKNNTSGHKGISWDADRKMWIAYINVHNKRVFLGRYAKLDAAVEARKRAEEKYHAPLIAQRDAETEGKIAVEYPAFH